MATLFCGCYNQKVKQNCDIQEIKQNEECLLCKIPEKCLALLTYGLLSDDDNDVPFGGACKDIASDSLVKFLQVQKLTFKRWQKMKEIDINNYEFSWSYNGDIGLLHSLIWTRITMGSGINSFVWRLNADFATEYYGSDNSFIWRLYMLGSVYNKVRSSFKIDGLNRIASFSDYAAYLDSAFYYEHDRSLGYVPSWCREVKRYAYELRKYSKEGSPSEDFLLRYYVLRCENEEGTPSYP